jgi:CheY-like chemotaxis protein
MDNSMNHKILLIEDNPADARLIVEAFDGYKVKNNLTIVTDGAEAMDYLNKKGKYQDRDCPSVIILDLNLPKKDGRDVLKDIKDDEKLKRIPVIVLTTSSDEKDIKYSYGNYASAYLTKPSDLCDFIELIWSFEDFWFKWVTLPKCTD